VILYGDVQNELFAGFHGALRRVADEGLVRYILRYRPVTGFSHVRPLRDRALVVSGYGVELMLKRTDYIVIDDREVEMGMTWPAEKDVDGRPA
jgi:UDP-glucose:glycoprotein glucosyltransferase